MKIREMMFPVSHQQQIINAHRINQYTKILNQVRSCLETGHRNIIYVSIKVVTQFYQLIFEHYLKIFCFVILSS
jgi:hypothetical protein